MSIISRINNKARSKYYEHILPTFNKSIKIGKNFTARKGLSLNANEGGKIEIGRSVFINKGCSINAHSSVAIGDFCILGENVRIYDHNHIFKDPNIPIAEQGFKSKPITIGKNCWIASNVTILCGTNIGDNCVIGAGCLIYKDVPTNTIVKLDQALIQTPRDGF